MYKKNHRGAAIVTVTCTLPTIMHLHWGWYRKYGQKYCCIKAMSMLNSHFGCLDRYYYPIPLGIYKMLCCLYITVETYLLYNVRHTRIEEHKQAVLNVLHDYAMITVRVLYKHVLRFIINLYIVWYAMYSIKTNPSSHMFIHIDPSL